jgi:hypothetical protein
MRPSFWAFFLFAVALLPARADGGPRAVLAIAIDPYDSGHVLVASPDGLYRSGNGGMTWTIVPSLPAGAVTSVRFAELQPGTVYAIAGDRVFKSIDRGVAWSPTAQAAATLLALDPSRPQTVYANGGTGQPNLVKTLDGGSSWMSVAIVDTDAQQPGAVVSTAVSRLLIDSRAPDVLYAVARTSVTRGGVTSNYDKVFKSFTGGAYWQAIPIGGNNLAISPHTSELYFSINDMVYVSADGGVTAWPSFVTYLSSTVGSTATAIAFNPVDSSRFYVATNGSWFVRTPGASAYQAATGTPARTTGVESVAVDTRSPHVIYAGSACGWPDAPRRACLPLVKSFDAGYTWRAIDSGYAEPELVALATPSTNAAVLYAEFVETVSGRPTLRVARSTDGGQTWTSKGLVDSSTEIVAPDGIDLFAAGPEIVYTGVPGRVLQSVNGSDDFQSLIHVGVPNQLSTQLGFAASWPDALHAAFDVPDAGTWVYEKSGSAMAGISLVPGLRPTGLYVWPANNATIYLTGFYDSTTDRILKSVNGGHLFTLLPFAPNQPIRDMAFEDGPPSRIFAATGTPGVRDGSVFESADGGQTWNRLGPAGSLFDVKAVATFLSDLFVADGERGIFIFRRQSWTWEGLGYAGATVLTKLVGNPQALYAGTPWGAVWRIAPRPFATRLDRSSAAIGLPLTFGGVGASGITPREYRFRRYDPAVGWLVAQDYSLAASYTWIPGQLDGGAHIIEISVRAAGSTAAELVEYTEFYVEPSPDPVLVIPFRYDTDALMDVLVYERYIGGWRVQRATAPGQFTIARAGGWAAGWDVAVADFNGDGRDDFFLYSSSTGDWFKVINTDAGFTYFNQAWATGFNSHVLDLNGDGRDDVFIHNPRTGAGYACISLGDGTGAFSYTETQWAPGFRVLVADFDGNGQSDLFIHRPIGGEYYKVIGLGNGSFRYSGGGWASGWLPTIADLNGDGRSDVFLYNVANGVAYRAVSTGDGTAGFAYTVLQWRHGWQVYPTDFDADGRSDLFVYDGASWEKVLNDGTLFAHAAGGWAAWSIDVTDLNGDGRSDVFLFDPRTGEWYQAVTTAPDAFGYVPGGFWVAQEGCQYAIHSTTNFFGSIGGAGTASVFATPLDPGSSIACHWAVTVSAPWIELLSPSFGAGNAVLPFQIGRNPGPGARGGTISLGSGPAVTILQAGF